MDKASMENQWREHVATSAAMLGKAFQLDPDNARLLNSLCRPEVDIRAVLVGAKETLSEKDYDHLLILMKQSIQLGIGLGMIAGSDKIDRLVVGYTEKKK